jgi:O-methyltransferase
MVYDSKRGDPMLPLLKARLSKLLLRLEMPLHNFTNFGKRDAGQSERNCQDADLKTYKQTSGVGELCSLERPTARVNEIEINETHHKIDRHDRRIPDLDEQLQSSLIRMINSTADAWDPDNAIEIVNALGNLAGKPMRSHFEEFPHAMFASRHSNYAPWLKDKRLIPYFDEVHPPYLHGIRKSSTRDATIVDIYRCWTIWQIVTQLGSVQGDFVEIGAFKGGTSALIGHGMTSSSSEGHLFICDTFKGVVQAGEHDNMYHGGEHSETSIETVEQIVSKFLPGDRFTVKEGIFPAETGRFVDGRKFRFAHLDVDVYQGTKESINVLWPNFSVGGVVVFDDYGLYGTEGVTRAVEEFAYENADALMIYNFNGQALALKMLPRLGA